MDYSVLTLKIVTLLKEIISVLSENPEHKYYDEYIDYKQDIIKIIAYNELAYLDFLDFENDHEDARLEGRLEIWVLLGLEINKENALILEKKVDLLSQLGQNIEQLTINNEIDNFQKNDSNYNLTNSIIVLYDFSALSKLALEHALVFAKIFGSCIHIVHIIEQSQDRESAEKQVIDLVLDTKKRFSQQICIESIVAYGHIFKSIKEIANNSEARMVIMATHGVTGLQHFTGSWALKVIVGSVIPFLVIQEKPTFEQVRTVLFPIDSRIETMGKLNLALDIAKYIKGITFKLCMPEVFKNEIGRNVAEEYKIKVIEEFSKNDILYDIELELDTNNIVDAVLNRSKKKDVDLILITASKNMNMQDFVLGTDEQRIIENSQKIPVLCINA